jgi:putative membrane-bound dehydrogenase-like protein
MSKSHRRDGKGKLHCSTALVAAALFCFALPGWSAESKPETNAAPRVASAPASNALTAFGVKPGFRLELVAQDPLVSSPVAMAFDENGRLFVAEMPEASGSRGTNTPSGRIRLLEDTEGTGDYHASTVYADKLPWVSAVICYGGGVFVAAGHDLMFLKDTRTNGIADERKVVFTGFGGTNTLETEALPNNFNWGLDSHIHAANAGLADTASASSTPGSAPAWLTGGDFSFDPRTLTVSLEYGPAESGLTFDDRGRKFVCEPMRPLRTAMYEPRYLARNPFFPPPPERVDVASPATVVFRLVPNAPLQPVTGRPVTTNELARAEAQVTYMLAPTWLTDARGCVVYRGNAFPSNYLGNVFIADTAARVIHRAVLREAGLDLTAVRTVDETNTEFVVSSDHSFRPVQVVNGPDGALYVADRQEGRKGGRIWRIVPANFKPPKPPQLGKASTYDLVAMLSHPNGWQRDTAARLLCERRDPAAAALLASMVSSSRVPLGRLHALHVLDSLGVLKEAHVLQALQDPDERVREHAVLLSERLVKAGVVTDALWGQLRLLATDPSVHVRYQLALTVGEIRRPGKAQFLTDIVWRNPDNFWIRKAILSSLADGAGDFFVSLAADDRVSGDAVGQDWLRRLATMIGVRNQTAEVAQVLTFLGQTPSDRPLAFALLNALGDGLHRARNALPQGDPQSGLRRFYTQGLNALLNNAIPEPLQVEEIRLVGFGPYIYANVGDLLLLELGGGQSEAIQSAAITVLGCYNDPRIAPGLIQRWGILTPRLRQEAVAALLVLSDRTSTVLTALENGQIAGADLSSAQVDFLRTHRDSDISRRALKLFGPVPGHRPEAVKRFKPALGLQGIADHGRGIFLARCAACHSPDQKTQALGPDLVSAKLYGKERILMAILEPNTNVRRDYLTYVAETLDGEPLIGCLRNENEVTITLQQVNGGAVVLRRTDIQYLQAQPWSLMPERMEEGLTPQDMADLLEYIVRPAATP